jgi:D-alanine-D-alanine ligase
MGGPSGEREVSLKSGGAVCTALGSLGYKVIPIDPEKDAEERIKDAGMELAFIALHGRFGEDGTVQAILESLGIPYTGSGVEASKLAMDKLASRKIFMKNRINVPEFIPAEKGAGGKFNLDGLDFPLVVKPNSEGSSLGLSIVEKEDDLNPALTLAWSMDNLALIERYIPGREMTVGILGDEPLPVIELKPHRKFYDYVAKYETGATEYLVPAPLPDKVCRRVQESALLAHKSLGCYGFSRVDMILNEENTPVVLEVNTIPGLTSTSLLPKAAKAKGLDFPGLIEKMIELALNK